MVKLKYYTTRAVDRLKGNVVDNLDWYYNPSLKNRPSVPFAGVRESRISSPDLAKLIGRAGDTDQPSHTDRHKALAVFQALSDLTPHQASDERLWVYLCHEKCASYVSWRWLRNRPDNDKDAVREVKNHFFAVGNRALIRDNGVSRLWWLGKIATDVAPKNPDEFLEILLHRQDVRSALIERPSVSMNGRVLRIIYKEMQRHWANGGKLFEREAFRSWMRALNRRGGVILLDALPNKSLASLVREEAEHSIEECK